MLIRGGRSHGRPTLGVSKLMLWRTPGPRPAWSYPDLGESAASGRLPRVHLSAAAEQAWPPFVLVSGLLLIGLVANRDGLFEQTGRFLQGLAGPPVVLLATCLVLVVVVTAVLNLDTAVVFLTPVLVHAARRRGIEEEAFLYGAVYMANASSLYLLGSNLTNLLVLDHQPISGGAFAARMFVIALTATLATGLGLFVLFRRRLRAAARLSTPSV